MAVVGEIDDAFEPLRGRQGLRMRQPGVVNDKRVEFISRLKRADLAEERAAALCAEIKRLLYGQRSERIVRQAPAQL